MLHARHLSLLPSGRFLPPRLQTLTAKSACSLTLSSAAFASVFHVGIERNNEREDLLIASTVETSAVATEVKPLYFWRFVDEIEMMRWLAS